jgi:hypothetical protein
MLFPGGAPAGVVDGRENVLFAAGVAVGVEPMGCVKTTGGALEWARVLLYSPAVVPKPNEGAEDVAAGPGVAPALPNKPPAGFGVSPSFLPSPPKPKDGVDAPPAV